MPAGVIKSAERVLRILEHFRSTRRPALSNEIARMLAIPQSSTSMLLRSLVTLGYLDYDAAARTFLPTLRVALLSDWLHDVSPAATPLMEALKNLQKATRETVILGRQNGPFVQYLSVLQQDQGLQLAAKVGMLRPMTLAAIGQMLLTTKTGNEVHGIIRRNNAEALSPELRVNEREMLGRLERSRERGYTISDALITKNSAVIAMLLPLERGTPPLAVGVGGPVDRITDHLTSVLAALRLYVAEFNHDAKPQPAQ